MKVKDLVEHYERLQADVPAITSSSRFGCHSNAELTLHINASTRRSLSSTLLTQTSTSDAIRPASSVGKRLRSCSNIGAANGSTRRGDWMLLYPIPPQKCFAVGPSKATTPPTIVPFVRELEPVQVEALNARLAATARRTVIAHPQADRTKLQNLLAAALGSDALKRRRKIDARLKYWGAIG